MGNKDRIDKKPRTRHVVEAASSAGTSTVQHLVFTAVGAAGSALVGAALARRGYAPKTVSGALAALGAGLAGIGQSDALRAVGAGAMSSSGAQLVLMLFSEYEDKKNVAIEASPVTSSEERSPGSVEPANANVVPLAVKAVAS